MTPDTSLMASMLQASLIVQAALLALLVMSMLSWFVIIKKKLSLGQARRVADLFEDDFWSGSDLTSLYQRVGRQEDEPVGLAAIFHAGFQEFIRGRNQALAEPEMLVASAQRAMRAAVAREADDLEMSLPMLATVGSIAPYIGLFGTVWGVMNAFRALGSVQQATLAQVAPGISEALVTTAIGLFAAIPAVMAYNRYITETDRLLSRYEMFVEEFSNILQRQCHTGRAARVRQAATG